jgi:tetratricopeptide (TPR) repeat protein
MADQSRLQDLRRRVDQDPASIAFAQLAEEYRRAGLLQEATDVCRAGLALHPAYLSARITLARALVDLGRLDEAQVELERILDGAPRNLAAVRALAAVYCRRGALPQALARYREAFALAPNDPDLEQTIRELSQKVGAVAGQAAVVPSRPVASPFPLPDCSRESSLDPASARPRHLVALEQWLEAIHVARAERHA